MTELRKAAEMALEAFEILDRRGGLGLNYHEYIGRKIKALRQALAQPEKQQYITKVLPDGTFTTEPVAPVDAVNISAERVDETAKREHEPIGYINGMHGGYMVFTPINPSAVYLNGTALYTAPPQKEWVGLSDEEIESELTKEFAQWWSRHVSVCRTIEAQLKEKNGG